ncbi:uncharacterized protein PODANS_5_9960 [Podospora anserina S mat+]|uniref:Podospora anserina S mat+ genomic DNA chromosome 5, supercontig 9 n=1 Tax=Podospora anserina (strain S / ATCC MYA-4624 / DSM 980 / FGSC 10383) TaxID=515849 RepID=B2AL92_PODAN|nr:uncharacterized protein PODANS_5_9960 [Podospora anserina S mat+]CAP64730.1 unnamed protein product [Podospora anserina S mat+]CDP30128.1 Putative protein of unknown function [Podospora anserina S mat+]
MSTPEAGNTLSIPAYTPDADSALQEITWSQSLRTKKANYYIVKAKNITQNQADVLLYIQDTFYKDESSPTHLSKLPDAKKEGGALLPPYPLLSQPNPPTPPSHPIPSHPILTPLFPDLDNFILPINDKFQYGQKNAQGENRWLVLHDKDNKLYQHRFIVATVQGHAAEWAKTLANSFGAGELASQVTSIGKSFVGHYLHTF